MLATDEAAAVGRVRDPGVDRGRVERLGAARGVVAARARRWRRPAPRPSAARARRSPRRSRRGAPPSRSAPALAVARARRAVARLARALTATAGGVAGHLARPSASALGGRFGGSRRRRPWRLARSRRVGSGVIRSRRRASSSTRAARAARPSGAIAEGTAPGRAASSRSSTQRVTSSPGRTPASAASSFRAPRRRGSRRIDMPPSSIGRGAKPAGTRRSGRRAAVAVLARRPGELGAIARRAEGGSVAGWAVAEGWAVAGSPGAAGSAAAGASVRSSFVWHRPHDTR